MKLSGRTIDFLLSNDNSEFSVDERFPILCKAVKAWASKVGLIGAHRGRLNSYTLCLMVISYLQGKPSNCFSKFKHVIVSVGVSPAILPCLQKLLPEMEGEIKVEDDDYDKRDVKTELEALLGGKMTPKNTSSLGSLFAGFLKYYAEFKWVFLQPALVINVFLTASKKIGFLCAEEQCWRSDGMRKSQWMECRRELTIL